MLVESLALREANNQRALAVKHLWFDTDFLPKKNYGPYPTLTDNVSTYASGFLGARDAFLQRRFPR